MTGRLFTLGLLPLTVTGLALLLSACAGFEALDLFGDECSRYESRTKSTRYNTSYKLISAQTLGRPGQGQERARAAA